MGNQQSQATAGATASQAPVPTPTPPTPEPVKTNLEVTAPVVSPPITAVPPATAMPTAAPTEAVSPTAPPAAESGADTNPGTFEDLHKSCKDLFPQVFEGAKVLINKGLSSHFQISHTMALSTLQPSGYRFGATYIGSKQLGPQESYPVMLGDMDVSGNLNAQIIHAFTQNTRSKFVAQIQNNKLVASQCSGDYKGKDFTATVTCANIDPVNESGLMVGQYLQKITPRLDLGAELVYQYGGQVPGGEMSILSLAGRLHGQKWSFTGNITPMMGQLHACYYQKVDDYLQIGAELDTNLRMQESTASVAYQFEIPSSGFSFKGQLDTNWCIQATMEKKLSDQLPFTFLLSAFANQVKSQYRFGIGLSLG